MNMLGSLKDEYRFNFSCNIPNGFNCLELKWRQVCRESKYTLLHPIDALEDPSVRFTRSATKLT